jgi:hypothetical protein
MLVMLGWYFVGGRVSQCGKAPRTELEDVSNRERDAMTADEGVHFVLPYGATLTVQKPAISILSSGRIAYPMHRPVGAVWEKRGAGKICVMGSGLMFADEWIGKEENDKLLDFVVRWLTPGSKVCVTPFATCDLIRCGVWATGI